MILKQFPDLLWLKQRTGQLGTHPDAWPTKILEVHTNREQRPDIRGPFSLFLNLEGTASVAASDKWYHLPEHCYFISNAGEHYSLDYDSGSTQTFNIHFSEGLIRDLWDLYTRKASQCLETGTGEGVPVFRPGLRRKLPQLEVFIHTLRNMGSANQLLFDQQLAGIAHLLFREELGREKQLQQLPLKRAAWKNALITQVEQAALLMREYPERNWSLEDLANAACLSRFHFLRSFKLVYGLTPHQFLMEERMECAKRMLQKGKLPGEVALALGFSEHSAFSRAFQRHFGIAPSRQLKTQFLSNSVV